jgi:hypothetical protein
MSDAAAPTVDTDGKGNPTTTISPVSVASIAQEAKTMQSKQQDYVASFLKIAGQNETKPFTRKTGLRRARSWKLSSSAPKPYVWNDDMRLIQDPIEIDVDLIPRAPQPVKKRRSPRQELKDLSPSSMQARLEIYQSASTKDRDVLASMTMERAVQFQEADRCSECEFQFTMLNRRHHCRMCSLSFCSSHSKVYQVRKTTTSMWDLSTHESRRLCKKCISIGRKVARRVVADDTFASWKAIPELGDLEKELYHADHEDDFSETLHKYGHVLLNIPLALPVYDRRQQDKDIKREHIKFNGVSFVGEGLLDRLVEAIENLVLGFGRSMEEVS